MSEVLGLNLFENPLKSILTCGLSLAGVCYVIRFTQDYKKRSHLTILRKKRQQERLKQFEDLTQRFPFDPERAGIVAIPFEELVQKLQKRELKATQVLEAYIAKSLIVNKEFNCITQFVPHCFKLAENLDELSTVKGPLHGVPICVREDHDIVGMDSTLGLSVNLFQPKTENATILRILMDAGAVPFCKTNLPQTTMSGGSSNPIYGTTLNPLNKSLSPGGSSSGTGCLVGAGGALFGLGTDIGGSTRIPAHACGISTLRSTTGRISGRGITGMVEETPGITCVPGILASTAKTLSTVYEIITTDDTQYKYDVTTIPIPWRSPLHKSNQNLRIGYFTSSPVFPAVGDTPETILKAKAALEEMGHTVVPFEIPNPWRLYELGIGFYLADGGDQVYQKLKHDEVTHGAQKFLFGRSIISEFILKKILLPLLPKLISKRMVIVPEVEKTGVLMKFLHEQRRTREQVLDEMKRLNLNLILAPVFPTPATRVKDADDIIGNLFYAFIWNVLNLPAGVVPFGHESCTKLDEYNDESDIFLKLARQGVEFAKGMPIGVQIIGQPYQEEMVLRILTELEDFKLNKSN